MSTTTSREQAEKNSYGAGYAIGASRSPAEEEAARELALKIRDESRSQAPLGVLRKAEGRGVGAGRRDLHS